MLMVSPSKLDYLVQCPRYIRAENPTDTAGKVGAANEGTMLHEKMELLVKEHQRPGGDAYALIETWTDLEPEHRWALSTALDNISALLNSGGTIYTEMILESDVTRRGKADLVVVFDDGSAVVIDYKMVRVEGSYGMQVKAYVVALMKKFPELTKVEGRIIAPRIHVDFSEHYTRDDYNRLCKEITDLMDVVENPFTPATPCGICGLCKWNGVSCPAQSKAVASMSQAIQMPITREIMTNPQTADDYGMRRAVIDWLEDFCAAVKKSDVEWGKRVNQTPTGYSWVTRPGSDSLDKNRTREAIDLLIAQGYDLSAIHDACKLSLADLAKSESELAGGDPKEIVKKLKATLSPFIAQGAGSTFLRKTSNRKSAAELYSQIATGAIGAGKG